ncbi:flagellar protein FlaG [Thiomicrospira sp. R3]|uniref:flagellar protein FlaG n=1 Tax=Thiomicrospira sp. R3 TaxID=3035472 RepID=UPI00259BE983|nr:flagellar protein FlaG [Thiomicrospira sp. R3]WFE67939.1 flagellar protein FlaG [Thiomicrospira sp. R3]
MDIHNNLTSPSAVMGSRLGHEASVLESSAKPERPSSDLKVETSEPEAQNLNAKDLDQIDLMNQRLDQMGIGVAFAVDQDTGSSIVKVVDKASNEVMKQFPNEDALRMIKNIQNYLDSATQKQISDAKGLTGSLINEII